MKSHLPLALAACALTLTACAQGNLRTPESYRALAPPPIRNPLYDPYAAYGSSDTMAPARLQPSGKYREAGRARLPSLTPQLRGRRMGDRGRRWIGAPAARHFLRRYGFRALGGCKGGAAP